jgi:peroxiredoxin Q/BCP
LALPEFVATNRDNSSRDASNLVGRPTVLFFYREAGDENCTTDACAYRDLAPSFESIDVALVGVSFSSPAEIQEWAEANAYPFELWTDGLRQLSTAYDTAETDDQVPRELTFVLDPEGQAVIRYDWTLSVRSDPWAVLEDCRALWANG